MRQRSIPEFQPRRGLAVRKAVRDLIAARKVSDRDISDAIASRMTCDICFEGGSLPLGSSLPEGFMFMGSLPVDSGAEAEEGSFPVLASTIEASCRWCEFVESSEGTKRAETVSKGLQLAQKLNRSGARLITRSTHLLEVRAALKQWAFFQFTRTPE
jgi:hypothetical protein